MLYTIGSLFIIVGTFFVISGIVGLIRLPSIFNKLHASSVADVMGVPLILLGLAMMQNNWLSATKILIMIPIIWIIGPISQNALAKAAYNAKNKNEE